MVDSDSLLDKAYKCNHSELLGLLRLIEFKFKDSTGNDSILSRANLVVTAFLAL